MADAMVERRPTVRFFCHRCNIEFEDVLQDYTCPYCASGFIEQLEETEGGGGSGDEFSDADMSNLDDMTTIDEMSNQDDSDDMPQVSDFTAVAHAAETAATAFAARLAAAEGTTATALTAGLAAAAGVEGAAATALATGLAATAARAAGTAAAALAVELSTPPMLNDLAFLMSGGRLRTAGRRETLMEQLVWMIGGGRGGTVTAGAPFVLVGAPGDYVFGGEGLDAVVTQLLGQLENAGPPPLPRDQINAIPDALVTEEQAANNATCSVCWEAFQVGETVSRLECEHIFHAACIGPWLALHATCPICRRSLLADEEPPPTPPPRPAADAFPSPSRSRDADDSISPSPTISAPNSAESSTTSLPRVVLRRIARRAGSTGVAADGETSSNSSMELGSSGPEWAEPSASPSLSASSSSLPTSTPRAPRTTRTTRSSSRTPASAYNMDMDFD